MKEIKVGDLVKFSAKKTMPAKTGEVVVLYEDGKADVYVMDEGKVYNTLVIKLKKI